MERATTSMPAPRAALPGLVGAQVVLPCADLAASLAFFTDQLGFRVEVISPADDPAVVTISGLGARLRLERVAPDDPELAHPPTVVLTCEDPHAVLGDGVVTAGAAELIAPNGSRIRLLPATPPLEVPPLRESFVVSRLAEATGFHTGRAGMGYRDLVPDRLGGRFIASHIRIDEAGPVPDYVHYHEVRFQMIFCARGWTRLVYEDQGDPFVMVVGDCVLQPPTIRHRVLEASAGLEVIELGCPAIHDTHADPSTSLPTGRTLPDRDYGNERTGTQRFVRHVAAEASWSPHPFTGFDHRDTGIAAATDGLAGARVLRPATSGSLPSSGDATEAANAGGHCGELWFGFVLDGSLRLHVAGHPPTELVRGDSVVVPRATPFRFERASVDLELLEVTLPADPFD